ncbi:unnamed protein product [Sphagnum troendelagicum]|uniref:Uncharacterized protein n=1 Tax=Sphagnum troendelagicum TaxID=128251 RepID=A0ABP0UPC4_9BRYO
MFTSRRKTASRFKLLRPVMIMAVLCIILLLLQLQFLSSCIFFNATRFRLPRGANHEKITDAFQPDGARGKLVNFSLKQKNLSPAAPVLQLRTAFVITSFHSYWQHLMLHMNIRGSSLIMHNIITGESRRMRGTTTTKVQRRRRYKVEGQLQEQRKSPRNHDQFTTSSRDHIITADSSANGAAAAALRILLQQEYSKKSSSLSRPRAAAADDTHLDYSQPQTHPPKGN